MARSYAKLLVEIWDPSGDFRDLTEGAQRLYMMLISHPQLSAAGVIPHQPRRWAGTAKGLTERKVERYLTELETHPSKKVVVDRDTEEVLVRAFIRRDGGANNPNISKAIRGAINTIESKTLRRIAEREMSRATTRPPQDHPPGSDEDPPEDSDEDRSEGNGQATSTSTTASTGPPHPATASSAQDSYASGPRLEEVGRVLKGTFSTIDEATA